MPKPLRRDLAEGRADYLAELRTAVPLFLRFEGPEFDADSEAAGKLNAFVRWAQDVLESHGGLLIGVNLGDKGSYLNGAFGAPTTHEDDGARAVAAASVLVAPPSSLAWVRHLGAGLGRGRMRAGTIGASERRTYAVLGHQGNLAAHLMALAGDGEVLVDREVLEGAGSTHRFVSRGEHLVKGQSRPIAIFAHAGRAFSTPPRAASVSDTSVLIGRDELLAAIERTFGAPPGVDRPVVWLVGEAGIGKTRIVRELERRTLASGRSVIHVAGEALAESSAYLAFREPIRRALELDRSPDDDEACRAYVRERLASTPYSRFAPLLAPVLPFAFPDDETTVGLAGEARADTTRELLSAVLLGARPAASPILFVDDAQFLDASSWSLLSRLRAERGDLVTVMCTRPFEEWSVPREWQRVHDSPVTTRIPVGALTDEAIAELVARRAGARRADEKLVELVVERAAGHPFFTEQLLQGMLELGQAEVVGDRCVARVDGGELESIGFPADVEGVVTSRLDRLPSEELLALKMASVIGLGFDVVTVAAIHPGEPSVAELRERFERLRGRELLVAEGERYAFRHAILQRVTYDLMLFAQRKELHARAAKALEARGGAESPAAHPKLAHHWELAEARARAVVYLDLAAAEALRQGAYDEAIRFVRRAQGLDPDGQLGSGEDRVARRLAILGEAEMSTGAIRESRRSLEAALAGLGEPIPSGPAGVVGRVLLETGTQGLRRFVPRTGDLDPRRVERRVLTAKVLRDLQPVYYIGNELPRMLHATLRATNLAESAPGHPLAEAIRAEGYAASALVASALGAEPVANAYRERALATGDALGDPSVRGQVRLLLALHSLGIGACRRAHEEAGRARELFVEASQRRRYEIARGTEGWALLVLGRYDEALHVWNDVRVSAMQRGDRQSLAIAHAGLAEALLSSGREGDVTRARTALASALEHLSLEQDRMFELHVLGLSGVAHARSGDVDEALVAFERAIMAMEATVPLSGYSVSAYARPAEGLLDLVERRRVPPRHPLVTRAVLGLERFARSFPVGRPPALRARGRLLRAQGDERAAKKAFVKSLGVARQLSLPLDEALARGELGDSASAIVG